MDLTLCIPAPAHRSRRPVPQMVRFSETPLALSWPYFGTSGTLTGSVGAVLGAPFSGLAPGSAGCST